MDPNDWTLTGNSKTNPNTNFLGTTDNEPLVIRTKGQERLRVDPAGNVGIGTAGPLATRLEIASDAISTDILRLRNTNAANPRSFRLGPGVGQVNIFGIYDDDAAATRLAIDYSGNVRINGNVSIGTSEVGARLQVEGGAYGITSRGSDVCIYTQNLTVPYNRVFLATTEVAGDFYGNVAFRNDVNVFGDVILTGADCAEEFEIAEAAEIEPGTVVVLDQDGVLHQSHQAYDKRVAGVISGAGDYKPGLILDRQQSHDSRVPVALVGKVYCKVDAQYAPIEVGDLLTTSQTAGHAMKADDPVKAFGSVIGKALRPLETGQGLVPILIALQ